MPRARRTVAASPSRHSSTAAGWAWERDRRRRWPSRPLPGRPSPGPPRAARPRERSRVHLSALRLRGFKSFPDTVELRLYPGVAVVVGPNGSGKSNLADAIQWALSALPPGRVRAHTTHDVLFSGSAVRAGSGTCEVELVLSNEDG